MPTTVQVSDEVRVQMEKLKKTWGLKTYDEVIRKMVRIQTNRPESMFGASRGSRRFQRDEEEEHDIVRD